MKVLHIIDSLALGGAERIAVNFSNALAEKGIETHLCVQRESGSLKDFINSNVSVFYLNKTSTFDLKAMFRLRKYIKNHKIDIIHAHSSSFFIATLAVFFTSKKLIWHDHNGNRVNCRGKELFILKFLSVRFNFIFSVNEELKIWAVKNLYVKKKCILKIHNFVYFEKDKNENLQDKLFDTESFKIVCLANLRHPKNHLLLLSSVRELGFDYQLYLVGQYNNDEYYQAIIRFIKKNNLVQKVYILGQRNDIKSILEQCDLGVLSSESEGLPVSLLEYGLAKLPVVCTNVGECSTVLGGGEYGLLVDKNDVKGMSEAITKIYSDKTFAEKTALNFYENIMKNYSKNTIIEYVISIYNSLLQKK